MATAAIPVSTRGSVDGRATTASARFLLYSHDGIGLGHVRRNLTLAGALAAARPDASALIVTGTEDLGAFTVPPGVDVLRLPGLRKVDNTSYAARRLAVWPGEVHDLRAGVLATAVECFRPDVVLADKHPAGAGGELVPALERLTAAGGRAALGLRDVLDAPGPVGDEWRSTGAAQHLAAFHHAILVYGQAGLLDPLDGCPVSGEARARAQYCGYVVADGAAPPPAARQRSRPRVLATVGGGEDGASVLRAFLGASAGAGWDALAVTGPQLAMADRAELERLAARVGARLAPSVRDLTRHLPAVDAAVCMGGYNTLAEMLSAGVPAVCVPRVVPRQEQAIRARAFAARGLLRVVEPAELEPGRLRAEVDAALATDREALRTRVLQVVRFDGASRAAAALLALADEAITERGRRGEGRR